jgi:hypothetical protein
VAGALQVNQPHERNHVSHVKARRRRIEPHVSGYLATAEGGFHLFGILEQLSTPFKLFEQRLRSHGTKLDKTT